MVDCPTCGRTLRVPSLDGNVAPLPEPRLDVNELAGALDELAKIGEERAGSDSGDVSAAVVQKPVVVKELAPLPKPEPISIDTPPPPVAVDVSANQRRSKPAPLSAPVVARSESATSLGKTAAAPSFSASLKSAPVLGTIAVTGLLTFALGWLIGGMGGSEPAESPPNAGDGKATAVAPKPELRPVYHPSHWKAAIRGRITYRTPEGSNKPDEGARIIVLPKQRAGQSKLPVTGFWSGANEADFRVAVAGLRELGGDAALADAEGKFEIALPPSAGSFHLIAISRYNANEFDTTIPASTRAVLAQYFDRPDALIRRLRFEHSPVRFSGDTVETWDHTFK